MSEDTKCKAQFARTVVRTGKWRGKKADKYVKYQKIKKQSEPTHRFDAWKGYVSLDGKGRDKYVRLGKSMRPKLILAKIYNKNKKKYGNA